MIKAFISTMYCGEGDFQSCLSSIRDQVDIQIEHHIIYNQSELQAHQNQIKTWLSVQDRFDVFIKVDADTVITYSDALRHVYDVMKLHDASSAQIRLRDFFTDSLISGLNFYTRESIFSIPTDEVFCDRSVSHKKFIHSDQGMFKEFYVPIGNHAYSANEKQAFHFGIHRGVKNKVNEMNLVKESIQKLESLKNKSVSAQYFGTKSLQEAIFLKKLAVLGFEKAYMFKEHKQFNYSDPYFNFEFQNTLNQLRSCE